MHWLKENGRLPSQDIDEYFEEIKLINELKAENRDLKKAKNEEIANLKALIEELKAREK